MTASSLLAAIEIAVFDPSSRGTLTLTGLCPDWLKGLAEPGVPIAAEEVFPFLTGFLEVAATIWNDREQRPLLSDIWVQTNRDGDDIALRATAATVEGMPFLLIQRLGEEFEERQSALQRSRDRGLDNERLERIARELSLATAEAEKTVQEKSDFLAGMSHDLRTPLNAMFGFTTILLQERAGSLNLKQRGYLEQIRHAAEHLQSLISDILDLSRIEAGFLDLRAEEFPLEDALGEVIETIAPLADAKAIRVCCAPADLRVAQAIYADRTRFLQILFNLLSNAIKFTSRGGTVSVSATTLPGGGGNLSRGYGPGHSARGTDRDLREVSSGPSARRRGWRRAWPDHNTPSCGTTRR